MNLFILYRPGYRTYHFVGFFLNLSITNLRNSGYSEECWHKNSYEKNVIAKFKWIENVLVNENVLYCHYLLFIRTLSIQNGKFVWRFNVTIKFFKWNIYVFLVCNQLCTAHYVYSGVIVFKKYSRNQRCEYVPTTKHRLFDKATYTTYTPLYLF